MWFMFGAVRRFLLIVCLRIKKTLKNPLLTGENSFLVVRVFLSFKFNSQRRRRICMAFVAKNVARVQFVPFVVRLGRFFIHRHVVGCHVVRG